LSCRQNGGLQRDSRNRPWVEFSLPLSRLPLWCKEVAGDGDVKVPTFRHFSREVRRKGDLCLPRKGRGPPSTLDAILLPVGNIYFELTETFNATQPVVALASGQAVVYYRVAIMSKDGDWVIRETPEACATVLGELDVRRAHYRPGAPLDVRWLSGGWSSHFEFSDERQRRVRCDFVSRPPRVSQSAVDRIFADAKRSSRMVVVDLDALIAMKQTQRAKDFAIIGELARLLPPEREIELTTDPDRIIALATTFGGSSQRPVARLAATGADRHAVVLALAEEIDGLQQADRHRVAIYEAAARPYLEACRAAATSAITLRETHDRMVEIAERILPQAPTSELSSANAQ
jgi:hypothetical protein